MGLFDIFKSSQKQGGQRALPEGAAYAQWSCMCDDDSCEECKSHDGEAWIPGLVTMHGPPLTSCKSPEGCRCMVIYVMKEESGAVSAANFIRKAGGRVTFDELAKRRK